jgi:high-affinity Fe2+/Pb2+ permease
VTFLKILNKKKDLYNLLDDETKNMLEYFMMTEGISDIREAIRLLLRKGYDYWLLEKKYSKDLIESGKIWDQSYFNLRASSGFVYYRLRLKDAIDEIKRLSITMSSLLADLESCYKEAKGLSINKKEVIDKIEKYRATIEDYLNRFIFSLREDVEDKSKNYIENEKEFINWIEENLKRYKELFLKKDIQRNLD